MNLFFIKNKLNYLLLILFSLFLCTLFIFIVESIFYFIEFKNWFQIPVKNEFCDYEQPDNHISFLLNNTNTSYVNNLKYREIIELNNDYTKHEVLKIKEGCDLYRSYFVNSKKIIYEATVNQNEYGIRRTYPLNKKGTRDNIFIFGGSFAFGQGVEDNETLPSQLSQKLKKYKVYNLAMPGSGVNDIVALLREPDSKVSLIKVKSAISIYVYIDVHVERLLGSMCMVHDYFRPYFKLTSNGIKHSGTFDSGRPFVSSLYRFLVKSSFIEHFKIGLPVKGKKEFDFYAQMLLELKREIKKSYNSRELYFLVYPGYCRDISELRPHLKKYGIPILDYSKLKIKKLLKNNGHIQGDGHPSPMGNKFLADIIHTDLKHKKIVFD